MKSHLQNMAHVKKFASWRPRRHLFFEAIRKEEVCLQSIPEYAINLDDSDEDENITLQNVNKLSKLLAKIVQSNNAKRMHKNVCKKLLPSDSNEC